MAKKNKKQTRKAIPKPQEKKSGQRKNQALQYLPLLFIIVLFWIIYFRTNAFDLVDWDDYEFIKNNPGVNSPGNFKLFFTSFLGGNYHPLTTLSWAINYHFGKLSGHGYHLTNLLIHSVNIILAYFLTRKLFERNDIAFFVAALFALHPMHTESIAWVSERKDLLYGMFFLAALIAYIDYIKSPGKYLLYGLSLFLFVLSLLSKSAAVVLPLVLVLLDFYKSGSVKPRDLLNKIPFFAISVVFGIIAVISQQKNMDYDFTPHFPWFERIFIAFYGLIYYLISFVFPVKMSSLHPYPVQPGESLPFYYYLSFLIIPFLILAIYYFKKQRRILIFGFGFFVVNLFLVIQLIPVGRAVVAERYAYMSYIGLYILIGYLLMHTGKKFKSILIALACGWFILLVYTTNTRIPVWKNSTTLFTDLIEKYPGEKMGYYKRGLTKIYNGDARGAYDDYSSAIKLDSNYSVAWYNRSLARMQMQDYKGMLADLNETIRIAPGYVDAHNIRGIAYALLKNYDKAISDFNFVLSKFPNDDMALLNRGKTYLNLNETDQACADFSKAMQAGNKDAATYFSSLCGKTK